MPPGITNRKHDGFVRVEPLPAGWYRIGGMELTREELRGLLPLLQADWGGVLYETGRPGYFSFWQVNGSFDNWCSYRMEREELATAEEVRPHHLLSEAGPHTLYRVHYLDPMRPGALPGLSHQHGFCVGYNRPGGPEMMMPMELINLPDYWPIEQLKTILSTEELESVHWPAPKPAKKSRKLSKSASQT